MKKRQQWIYCTLYLSVLFFAQGCSGDPSSGWFWIDQDQKAVGPLLLTEPAYLDKSRVLWPVDDESGAIALPTLETVYLEDDCGGEAAVDASGLFDMLITGERTSFHIAFRSVEDDVIRIPSDMTDVAVESVVESRRDAQGMCVDIEPATTVTRLLIVDTTTVASEPDVAFAPPFHTKFVGVLP